MNIEQQKIKDWMIKFGQDTPKNPCIPSLEVRKLRAKLILEEALETIEALGLLAHADLESPIHIEDITFYEYNTFQGKPPSLIEIADGLADLNYVSYGTAVACGLDMEPIEAEVHRSNMSKLWKFKEVDLIKDNHSSCAYVPFEDAFVVKDECGKVIKSPSYSQANLKPIIDSQS